MPSGRYELAKDVSAFANAEGGHIVIGLTHKEKEKEDTIVRLTHRLPEHEITEEISGLELISEAEFDIHKYKGLIKHYIFPQIDNIEITWQKSAEEKGKGIGHIFIPPQEETKKYFLITRGIVIEGEKLKDNVVGLAIRDGSSNEPISGSEIYKIMLNGKSETAQRLGRIENMLAVIDGNMSIMFNEIRTIIGETKAPQISFDKLYEALRKATE